MWISVYMSDKIENASSIFFHQLIAQDPITLCYVQSVADAESLRSCNTNDNFFFMFNGELFWPLQNFLFNF